MAGFGAVVGPVALAWELQHTSGTSASLMLTLEALFTAVLAWRLFRETMEGRVWAAMALLLAGGMVLVLDQGRAGGAQLWGLLAVLLATAAWGVDNTLSRALAERDPGQVVMVKALLGTSATVLLAVALGGVAAIGWRRLGLVRHRCNGLRPEPALLSSGAKGLWRGQDGIGLCIRALHRCRVGGGAGRPLGEWLDGSRQRADVGRCGAAPGGIPWPRACARRTRT